MPNIKKVKKGTYDKFRGYADNVFVVKGGFTTTEMIYNGDSTYTAYIPGQPIDSQIEYYIELYH